MTQRQPMISKKHHKKNAFIILFCLSFSALAMEDNDIPIDPPQDAIMATFQQVQEVWDWAEAIFAVPSSYPSTSLDRPESKGLEFSLLSMEQPNAGMKKSFIAPPFSFKYGGQFSSTLLRTWKYSHETTNLSDRRIIKANWTDPLTGLAVSALVTLYKRYPAVDWVLYFENQGKKDTPIIANIQALDLTLNTDNPEQKVIVHQIVGDVCNERSFIPFDNALLPRQNLHMAPQGGRSSNGTFPFFNLQYQNQGLITAIGWSGQWAAHVERNKYSRTRTQAGMEQTHLLLHPGERIRSPRVLLLPWKDDLQAAHNRFRRLLLFHYTPRQEGRPVRLPIASQCYDRYVSTRPEWATEAGQIKAVRMAQDLGFDTHWFDAAWFDVDHSKGVGNWRPKPQEFPNGLKPVGDACRQLGMRFVLWFEPERVWGGKPMAWENPEFIFKGGGDGLYKLNDAKARRRLTELLSQRITEYGINIYRNDFNIDPLSFWRENDTPDRQGMTEIRYVEGHYEMWDELLTRHPGLVIDNCASGGRRIDLETIMRSVPLWRSDTNCAPGHADWNQAQTYGLSLYLPLHTACGWTPEIYDFRSSATAGAIAEWDIFNKDFPKELGRATLAEVKENQKFWYGDFYPLTSCSTLPDQWMAYQFHRPDLNAGIAMIFRRKDSRYTGLSIGLRALNPSLLYSVETSDDARQKTTQKIFGRELMDNWELHLPQKKSSLLIRYQPIVEKTSLDELDRASYHAAPSPFDAQPIPVQLENKTAKHRTRLFEFALDGAWQLAEGGNETDRLAGDWTDAIPAQVPGSIHTALWQAGKIPDPYFAMNDAVAEMQSYKTWWYKKEFVTNEKWRLPRLTFGGVAIKCTVWLNGRKLGQHEGMFAGPEFEIKDIVKGKNVLVVKIEPAPKAPDGWKTTVVFNCVYGWHYSKIPSLGIWRSVKIVEQPAIKMEHPFITTQNAQTGAMKLAINMSSHSLNCSGELLVSIEPENFIGGSQCFSHKIKSISRTEHIVFQFAVQNPQLWWPNDLGSQNLYKLKVSFKPADGGAADSFESTFGIRTIEMQPLPGGPYPDKYNWTFVINGKPSFVKGTGWCTMDPLMNFTRERYDRFLSLARLAHVQMLRGWGGGMPETDEFYSLCDHYGILIMQEWPTAWNSHVQQPYDALEETVRMNTLRLRNHPSLAMWGGGNESSTPFGKAIDMMGKLSIELDGTRPFHRGEPWGGSAHDYSCYWGREPLDYNLKMTADFWGEFGIASLPAYESVIRYVPENEISVWPPKPDQSFVHHTPIFGTAQDYDRLAQYSGYFLPADNLKNFISGSELAQVVAVRHPLERARARWPDCTGALYYKMNDNYPGASWSCVDWYGAAKPLLYFAQDAFAPLAAMVLFDSVNNEDTNLTLPVYLADDAGQLQNKTWQIIVKSFNQDLKEIKKQAYSGTEMNGPILKAGFYELSAEQTRTSPLFVVADIYMNQTLQHRNFYFVNFERYQGCLFNLPRTTLSLKIEKQKAIITNTGRIPAVAVNLVCPGYMDRFMASDNFFWLDAGESKTVDINLLNVQCDALNMSGNSYVNYPVILGATAPFKDSLKVEIKAHSGQSRYTLDNSGPSEQAMPYSGPFYINNTCTVKAVQYDNGLKVAANQQSFEKIPMLPAVNIPEHSLKKGLGYRFYQGSYGTIAEIPSEPWQQKGVTDSIRIPLEKEFNSFAYRWDGYLKVDRSGYYAFHLSSDDGSALYLDDRPIVLNDGNHDIICRSNTVGLAAGLHAFKLLYYENGGNQDILLEWQGADFARKTISKGRFYYK